MTLALAGTLPAARSGATLAAREHAVLQVAQRLTNDLAMARQAVNL